MYSCAGKATDVRVVESDMQLIKSLLSVSSSAPSFDEQNSRTEQLPICFLNYNNNFCRAWQSYQSHRTVLQIPLDIHMSNLQSGPCIVLHSNIGGWYSHRYLWIKNNICHHHLAAKQMTSNVLQVNWLEAIFM